MVETEMVMVFCYDVADARRRRRAAAALEKRAVRVQESVFEARMTTSAAQRLFARVSAQLGTGDSLRLYAVTAAGMRHCRATGGAPLPEDRDFWLF